MPEGPSLIILKEKLEPFSRKKVTAAGGYTKMETAWLKGQQLKEIKTWGKHLLLIFPKGTVRIHLRLFGSVLVNETKKVNASFFLKFGKDEVNFYVVEAKFIKEKLEDVYDWRTDIMDPKWNAAHVKELMKVHGEAYIGDLLMNQDVFTGVGNIIRVEVLFRVGLHPLAKVADIPATKITALLKDLRAYGKIFLKERKAGIFGDNWEAYQQEICPRDDIDFHVGIIGKTKRKTYYCNRCQLKYKS
ncbi:MAG: endonuclease [Ferruginibacter sp.]|nr:endonuclease [Ferruginibacter sp.]